MTFQISKRIHCRNIGFVLIVAFLSSSNFKAQAQDTIPEHKIYGRPRNHGMNDSAEYSSSIFLHLNKTVYLANEKIWFAGYLLNASDLQEHHSLYVVLVNDYSRQVVGSQSFMLVDGLSAGSFDIPDTLLSGDYSVFAYTNIFLTQPNASFFRQTIKIFGAAQTSANKSASQISSTPVAAAVCVASTFKNKNPLIASIQPDSGSYHSLSKIVMRIKVHDANGLPVQGYFSFSAALSKTNNRRFIDINNFNNYAAAFPTPKADDGYVLHNDKPLKKPVEMLLAGSSIATFTTDDRGGFSLPYLPLRGNAGTHALLSVLNHSFGYSIIMNDPEKLINDSLARLHFVSDHFSEDEFSPADKNSIVQSKNIALKEVVVKASIPGMKGYFGKLSNSGTCNDYVCRLGFLNCMSHPRGSPGTEEAIDGRTYFTEGLLGTETVLYHCQYKSMPPYIQSIKFTAFAEEFYPFNPADQHQPEMLRSTLLHWQSLIAIDEKGEATISFYSNELTGKFTAVIEGIAKTEVFSARVNFDIIN